MRCISWSTSLIAALLIGGCGLLSTSEDDPLLDVLSGHNAPVFCVAVAPDLGTIAASGDAEGGIVLWDISSGEPVRTFTGHTGPVFGLAITPELDSGRRYIVSGSADGSVRVWNAATGVEVWSYEEHDGPVNSVAVSLDGSRIATSDTTPVLRLFDIQDGDLTTLPVLSDYAFGLAWTPGGVEVVAAGRDALVTIVNVSTGAVRTRLTGHESIVTSAAVTNDAVHLVTGSTDRTARIWDLTSGETIRSLTGHEDYVTAVVVDPAKDFVATASWDGAMRMYGFYSGSLRRTIRAHPARINGLAITPHGRMLLTAGGDGLVKVWRGH
jgi:WD40 repeat protein